MDPLDFVPEGPLIKVQDYDPDDDIRVNLIYNGTIALNAWATDEDFDVAPRFVERYSGIKYASVFNRFERSQQAYGYTYTEFNTSAEDPNTREIFLNANKFGPMCIQSDVDDRFMSEDCLYLNLWRPSRWKQQLNTTTLCKQKFLGGGMYRKDCEVIVTTRTTETDGSIVIRTNTTKSSRSIPMGGLYDRDGSMWDGTTNILDDNKELKKKRKKKKNKKPWEVRRNLQGLSDTMDNLDNALSDLNNVIENENKESEDEKKNDDKQFVGSGSVDNSGLLPVMVYIHGGGFMEGSGNDPMFDGSKAAGRGQVIIITLNYRLGIFGFLPVVGWDQWKVNGGMNGFMDIVEALIWINRNIVQFGGDPEKVTVFGPSSTPAVCLLTMCPLAAGKFQRAILQTSSRTTEVANGHFVTENGVSGASCLLSSQEPYQPLEGRIETGYKFLDYINETYYNFPENPNPSREDLVAYLRAFAFNSSALWQASLDEGTIFGRNQQEASFDYNREGNTTGREYRSWDSYNNRNALNDNKYVETTHQRRTFMTWDNDVFPRMPVDLEYLNTVDMIVGVRGRWQGDRKAWSHPPTQSPAPTTAAPTTTPSPTPGVASVSLMGQSENERKGNIFLRNENRHHRYLQDANSTQIDSNSTNSNSTDIAGNNTIISSNGTLSPDTSDEREEVEFENEGTISGPLDTLEEADDDFTLVIPPDYVYEPTKCRNVTVYYTLQDLTNQSALEFFSNQTMAPSVENMGNSPDGMGNSSMLFNITEVCEDVPFDFLGTTNDQDVCLTKQFAEIAARNVEGNVYAYVLDDMTELFGYKHGNNIDDHIEYEEQETNFRRRLHRARKELNKQFWDQPERTRKLQRMGFDYDLETLYFFDNLYVGQVNGLEEVSLRKEIFHRWIAFAKSGVPNVEQRIDDANHMSRVKGKGFMDWAPIPNSDRIIGCETDRDCSDPTKTQLPPVNFLYMAKSGYYATQAGDLPRSVMLPLDQMLSHRTTRKYGDREDDENIDICSWVLSDEQDNDSEFVEVLLDFSANTAFEYYVTILATLNPTINYVPDRQYIVNMPPTIAPTTVQDFIDNTVAISSSPPNFWIGNCFVVVAGLLGFVVLLL